MTEPEPQRRLHYIHRLGPRARERLAGLFVLTAILLLALAVIGRAHTAHLFEKRVHYQAVLRNAQGLGPDSRVRVAGIEVGQVSDFRIDEQNRIYLQFYVYKRYQPMLRRDSWGSLSRTALIGDAFLDIHAGSPEYPILKEGDWIPIVEPMTPDQLMEKAKPVVEDLQKTIHRVASLLDRIDPDTVASGSRDLAAVLSDLRAASAEIRAGRGAIGRAVYDRRLADDLSRSMAGLASSMEQLDQRLTQLGPVLEEVRGASAQTRQLAGQMNEAMRVVNTELQQLPEIVSRMQLLLADTERTLQAIQRIWPLSDAVQPDSGELLIEPGQGE
ncbi:MAG: MCE family protein [Gammaproteobacteria bacterium]|nr:MAG: MCE family protein [Gammaproteobacteria bacterium]